MAEVTISHRPFTPEEEGRNDDQDLEEEEDDDDREEDDEKDRDTTAPTTPEPPTEDGYQGEVDVYQESMQHIRGKKRARRAKGKKKKQKTSLMITNDDGTDSTTQHLEGPPGAAPPRKKVYLRPSNNPLLRAPKNSTQFIIDDHENSQHFLSFQRGEGDQEELSEEEIHNRLNSVEEREEAEKRVVGGKDAEGDFWIDPFRNAYSEKDFDTVYENAHQEQVYSWERTKIIEEIAILELKQKRLITMLSQIDPVIYLQKLQQELSALQETNRRLKLTNIAERLERNQRGGSRTSSPRLPDSTSGELRSRDSSSMSDSSSSSSSSSSGDEDNDEESEVNIGGCSSGCCLASPKRRCDVANLNDVEEENEEDEKATTEDSVEKSGLKNPEVGSEVKEATNSSIKSETPDADLGLEKTSGQKNLVKEKKDKDNPDKVLPEGDLSEVKTTQSTESGKEDEASKSSGPETAGETTLRKATEASKEEKLALKEGKEESNTEVKP